MSSNVTLSVLREAVRSQGEFDSTDYFPTATLNEWINDSIAALYDILSKADPARYQNQARISVIATHTGTGDSIAITGTTCVLTDAGATFTSNDVDNWVTITGCANAGNNGTFLITAQTATTITYTNAAGVNEAVALTWDIDTESYALPSDFFKLRLVEVVDTSRTTGWRQLSRLQWKEVDEYDGYPGTKEEAKYDIVGGKIWFHPPPTWTDTVRIKYIPTAPSLSSDSDTFDSINLWTKYIKYDVAEQCALRDESFEQAKGFAKRRDRVLAGLMPSAEADHAGVRQVVNVNRRRRRRYYPT